MLPVEIERLWSGYLATERVRIRHESRQALERFIEALTQLPNDVWHPWARQFTQQVLEGGDETPIRLPLFRSVIFPALFAGMRESIPGSARWLAGLFQLLYKSPACRDQLPEDQRIPFGLLLRALQDDPNDSRAKTQLLDILRSDFEYALHELPAGVLYGHNSASIAQCDELAEDLAMYERSAAEIGLPEDVELIGEARFHISAYRRYLSERDRHVNYEQFLASL